MPPCYHDCDLRDLLRTKETKINKLKQILNDLDNLCFHQPHCHREVVKKMTIVNEMIEKTLAEARDVIIQISHGCKKVCNPVY